MDLGVSLVLLAGILLLLLAGVLLGVGCVIYEIWPEERRANIFFKAALAPAGIGSYIVWPGLRWYFALVISWFVANLAMWKLAMRWPSKRRNIFAALAAVFAVVTYFFAPLTQQQKTDLRDGAIAFLAIYAVLTYLGLWSYSRWRPSTVAQGAIDDRDDDLVQFALPFLFAFAMANSLDQLGLLASP